MEELNSNSIETLDFTIELPKINNDIEPLEILELEISKYEEEKDIIEDKIIDYKLVEEYLNLKAKYYLHIIYKEYINYFNELKSTLFNSILKTNIIKLKEENERKELIYTKDNKIYIFPKTLKKFSIKKCEISLIEQLFNIFISPKPFPVKNIEYKEINEYITKALIGLFARDFIIKNGLYEKLDYKTNKENYHQIDFIESILKNKPKDEILNLSFNGSVQDILESANDKEILKKWKIAFQKTKDNEKSILDEQEELKDKSKNDDTSNNNEGFISIITLFEIVAAICTLMLIISYIVIRK